MRTCRDLAGPPLLELSERLGQEGVRLHELARGAIASLAGIGTRSASTFDEELELDTAEEELEPLSSYPAGALARPHCARGPQRPCACHPTAIHVRFDLDDPPSRNGMLKGCKNEYLRLGATKILGKNLPKNR